LFFIEVVPSIPSMKETPIFGWHVLVQYSSISPIVRMNPFVKTSVDSPTL